MTAIAVLAALPRPAQAGPNGGQVVGGSASISQAGNTTNINQSSGKAIINWQGFSIGKQETVNFNQPNASSMTLNRVIGNEASVINGALNANGKVFIVNSAGVLFGKGSQVNVGGLVASTLDIADSDFMAGRFKFSGNSSASVVNQGRIRAGEGGYVALLGKTVTNDGVISARLGTVALSSGEKMTLNFGGDSLVDVTIDKGTLNALVENKRAIRADGGRVIMTAKAADELLSAQVNNTGVVRARSIADLTGGATRTGNIRIQAYGGKTKVAGKLDASAPNGGDGGFIETSGNKVEIDNNAVITTKAENGKNGTWLIDPDGFTIGLNGDMTGAFLTNQLMNNNVTIWSTNGNGADGNINVNDAVSWSANTLTLNATNNIFVNNVMTATGTAGFAANYGVGTNADGTPHGLYTLQSADMPSATNLSFAGKVNFSGSGFVTLNGEAYTVISDLSGLDAAKSDPNGRYVLGADLSGIASWSVGLDNDTAFTGKFNGFGHRTGYFVTSAESFFGNIGAGALISNFGLNYAYITANSSNPKTSAGTFADVNQGSIVNSFAGGTFFVTDLSNPTSSAQSVGGMVGTNSGLIAQSFVLVDVQGVTNVAGGLVGTNTASGRIIESSARALGTFSTQRVTGSSGSITYVGGLVGVNQGTIEKSYAQNSVQLEDTASNAISGGFVGLNTGTIDQSYSAFAEDLLGSTFHKGTHVAGFVGENAAGGTIRNSYATSANNFDDPGSWDAGFAYKNAGTIETSYAISDALGSKQRYGFVFDNTGAITNSYWYVNKDIAAPDVIDLSTATRLTETQKGVYTSYAGLDQTIWGKSSSGFPILRNIPVYVDTIPNVDLVYGSVTADISTLSLRAIGLQGGGAVPSNLDSVSDASKNGFAVITENGYVNAGSWDADKLLTGAAGAYANVKGVVTVKPKALTLTSVLVNDKVYDGTTFATLAVDAAKPSFAGLVGDQKLNVAYTSAQFANKNAGLDKVANLTYVAADGTNGGKASNYIVPTTTVADISKKQISAGATGNDKVYDGTTAATVNVQVQGLVAGDNVAVNYTAAFSDKNAGQNKSVAASELTLTGADANNYVLQNSSIQTSANITPRRLDLAGSKVADGSATVSGADLTGMNVVAGDNIQIGGTATISSAASGLQPIANTGGLTVNNPNYTIVGSIGSVIVSGGGMSGGQVVSGSATINTVGNATTVTQSTSKAIIDWARFSIAANESVTFVQPSSTSVVLNRVIGNETSVIAGALNANGRVFIVNSAGVLFQAGSQVNVAALVATTLNISNSDFDNGNYLFIAAGGTGPVISKGDIIVVDGGFVALASENGVSQSGSLTARGGKALLASANTLTLNLNAAGPGLDSYSVANLSGAVAAAGTINVSANGGADGSLETAGVRIAAAGLNLNTGTSGLWSWTQNAIVVGNGGSLTGDFLGDQLDLNNLTLKALTGSIDVNDAVTWSSDKTLALNAATDININHAVTATGVNAGLRMNFGGDYNIRTRATYSGAVLDASERPVAKVDDSGGVYGKVTLSGANSSLAINGQNYVLIRNMSDLAAISGITGYYALANDLDASGTTYSASVVANLTSSTLTGLGHAVKMLNIGSSAEQYAGLVGTATSSTIRDIGVIVADTSFAGNGANPTYFGLLAGLLSNSTVRHAYSEGNAVTDKLSASGTISRAAGLVGKASTSTISDSFSSVSVNSTGGAAGLVGSADTSTTIARSHAAGHLNASSGGGLVGETNAASITDSYATGNLTTPDNSQYVGGLVGYVDPGAGNGNITNSFATGSVDGGTKLGGLIGYITINGFQSITVENSYATGSVTGRYPTAITTGDGVGGLVGFAVITNGGNAAISRSFATGNVTLSSGYGANSSAGNAGGLIGQLNDNNGGSTIDRSYATGNVYAPTESGVGGLGGRLQGVSSITNSYATGNVTGFDVVGGLAGYLDGGPTPAAISNWYSNGKVTGLKPPSSGTYIGGLIGQAVKVTTDATVFYNAEGTSGAIGNAPYRDPSFGGDKSQGLTGQQLLDAPFYVSGRIYRVLAERTRAAEARAAADAAATRAAMIESATQSANVISNDAETSSTTSPDPRMSRAGTSATQSGRSASIDDSFKSVEDKIKADDTRRDNERRRAAAKSQQKKPERGGFSPTIRSIDVDGQRFDLQNTPSQNNAPAPNAQ